MRNSAQPCQTGRPTIFVFHRILDDFSEKWRRLGRCKYHVLGIEHRAGLDVRNEITAKRRGANVRSALAEEGNADAAAHAIDVVLQQVAMAADDPALAARARRRSDRDRLSSDRMERRTRDVEGREREER
jgi:hypothetical protein